MKVLVWIAQSTWPACVDAARDLLGGRDDVEVTLACVTDDAGAGAAHDAFTGLMGRGRRADPRAQIAALAAAAAQELLAAAAERLGRPATTAVLAGGEERAMLDATEGVDLLIVARDGDRSRLGPKSIGPHTRFVIDHVPCDVLVVWPEPAPSLSSVPLPPAHDKRRA